MSNKDLWLSTFDPDQPEASLTVEQYPVDLVVTEGELSVTDNSAQELPLGKFAAFGGVEQINVSLAPNGNVISTTTEQSAAVGKLRRTVTETYAYSGLGFLDAIDLTPGDKTWLVELPVVLLEETLETVLTQENIRYTSPGVFSSFYGMAKLLTGTAAHTTDGTIWASTSLIQDRHITVTFPEVTEIAGFLVQNMRSDYATLTGVLEAKDYQGNWYTVYEFDLSTDLLAVGEFTLVDPIFVTEVRLRALTTNNVGGLGRLEFFKLGSDLSGTLHYKPLVIDAVKFDSVEDSTSISLSLKGSGGGEGGTSGTLPYLNTKYVKLESRRAASAIFGHSALNAPRAHPFTHKPMDTLGLPLRTGVVKVPVGTYRYKLTTTYAGNDTTIHYLFDAKTSSPIADSHSTHSVNHGISSVNVYEGEFALYVETVVGVASIVTNIAEPLFRGTTVTDEVVLCTLELWQVSIEPTEPYRHLKVKPTEVTEWVPFTIIDSVLQAGDGRGLDDGILDNSWGAANGQYWSAGSHYLTFKVDHDFRLWRYPNASYPNYNAALKVERLSPIAEDLSNSNVAVPNSNMVWSRVTDALPPGIYRMSHTSSYRMDAEWCLEKAEWGSGTPVPRGDALIAAMTANNSANQIASASTEYSGSFGLAFWAFDRMDTASADRGWTSSGAPSEGAPQWLAIAFDSVKTATSLMIRNRSYPSMVQSPNTWKLQGRTLPGDWVDLHSVVGDTIDTPFLEKFYVLDQPHSYQEFRIYITAVNGGSPYVIIDEMQLYYYAP